MQVKNTYARQITGHKYGKEDDDRQNAAISTDRDYK